MKKNIALTFAALTLLIAFAGCNKPEAVKPEPVKPDTPVTPVTPTPQEESEQVKTNRAVNFFAKNFYNLYYLWTEECYSKLSSWSDTGNPADGYAKYKYSADRWGFITDDYKSMNQAIEGVSTTPGMSGYFTNYKDTLAFCPKIVYPGTPADKAGIKRGDFFTSFDGKVVLCPGGSLSREGEARMYEIYESMYTKTVRYKYAGSSRTVSVTPVEMYEDPVVCHKVFDFNGKKVGYLFYDAFVLESVNPLLQVFREFEAEGVSELILDLRYNGGGDVIVEEVIASVLAPKAEVDAKSVFTRRVYNKELNAFYSESDPESLVSRFGREFSVTVDGRTILYDISDINLDIKKMHVIYTGDSASASEALVVGLKPYLDIQLYGENSFGKYCSCVLLPGESWYNMYKDDITEEQYANGMKYAKNWACYLTMSRFADKDGNTGNYPNGFSVAVSNRVKDAWYDPEQFGDPKEKMLAKVLSRAGYADSGAETGVSSSSIRPMLGDEPAEFLDTRIASKPVWGLDILPSSSLEPVGLR